MPTEPSDSRLREGIRALAYPCRERQGIVWAYMGPQAEPPPLPELPWALVPPAQRGAFKYQRACNWLQALEGDVDTAHLGWLHTRFTAEGGREAAFHERDRLRDVAVRDTRPALEVRDTAAGVVIGARRNHEAARDYWRITQFLMPIFTSVPAIGAQGRAKAWVPLDDTHTLVWEPNWHATDVLSDEDRQGRKGRVPASGMLPDDGSALGRVRFAACLENEYLIDRSRQRESNFSGIEESPPAPGRGGPGKHGSDRGSQPRAPRFDGRGHHPCPPALVRSCRRAARRARRAARRRGTRPPTADADARWCSLATRTGSPLRKSEQRR